MSLNVQKREGFYTSVLRSAIRASAYGTLLNFLIYRTPLKVLWARLQGHRFHRSSMLWYVENDSVHTRAAFLLERAKADFPGLEAVDIQMELFDEKGNRAGRSKWLRNVPPSAYVAIESRSICEDFGVDPPFSGTLMVRLNLRLPDVSVRRRQQSLFHSTHTHIDYYSEGNFVTTLHDYCAFLPDQGINPVRLGHIPAYADRERETFLLMHAAAAGVGARDMQVHLYNADGQMKSAFWPAMKPFSFRKIPLHQLFPDVERFLGDRLGQVVLDGFLRQMLRRSAYGVQNRGSEVFSLDHCFYTNYDKHPIDRSSLKAGSKGAVSPFLILEDEHTTSAAIIFQCEDESQGKNIGALVYDAEGECVAQWPGLIRLRGNSVEKIEMRPLLEKAGIPLPFVGHAELVLEPESGSPVYESNFEHSVEYSVDGKLASVLHGSDFWNSPEGDKINPRYNSGNRIVCNASQTTFLAIHNCSHAADYARDAHFTLRLIGHHGQEASTRLVLKPHGTLYRAIDDIFPDAQTMLEQSGGVGIALTTEVDCKYLTHAFLTADRRSGALSVEHSISCAGSTR